jgi:thiol-disulfide isomerase/thioredoxin
MIRFFSRRTLLGGMVGAVVIAAFAAGVGLYGIGSGAAPPPFRGNLGPFAVHASPKESPAFSFTELDGTPRTLADFRGRVLLINFWATWCAPCIEEMPALDRLHAKLGGDAFAVIALSTDRQGRSLVEPFLGKLGLQELAIYLDSKSEAMRALGLRGLPTTILFDREGREIGRLEGAAAWDSAEAEALIRYYLGPPRA